MMTFPYVRRKQPRLGGAGDGKWHRAMDGPKLPKGVIVSQMSPREWDNWLNQVHIWRVWREHPQTLCGQAYIAKYWISAPNHDHFRGVCEDCQAELTAMILTERVEVDKPHAEGV